MTAIMRHNQGDDRRESEGQSRRRLGCCHDLGCQRHRHLRHILFMLAVTSLTASISLSERVHAQETIQTPNPALPEIEKRLDAVDKNKPMLLQADELIYDNRRNRVIARGNVEIYFNNYTLTANQVIYDRSRNVLAARGDVRIKEPDGAVIQAEEINLTDDFREGFINSLRAVTRDEWRIAASKATRVKGNTTVFENAVATPCPACKKDPTKPPTWQVKATKVIHDQNAKTIEYENASLEIFGVPVAYVPYFKHADPTVKRQSGFLVPRVSHSDQLGLLVETPYFFNLAPNYDFTLSPMLTTQQGVLLKGEWRHRLANGAYNIKLAGIYQSDRLGDTNPSAANPDRHFRGSIQTEGKFKINQQWQYGWDITADTDDSFRRYYKLDNIRQTDRVSNIYLRGIGERSYFGLEGYHFGGLLLTDTNLAEARVHPVMDLNYIFSDPVVGGELSLNMNGYSLTRPGELANVSGVINPFGVNAVLPAGVSSIDSHRFDAELAWRKTLIDSLGQTVTPFFKGRGQVAHSTLAFDTRTQTYVDGKTVTRGVATAGLDYRYPFVAHTPSASHIFEPIAQIIYRNSTSNRLRLANEDAQSLVYDDTLLFDHDKFSGYDLIETGTRVNAGLQYTMNLHNGGTVRLVAGQSFHIGGENPYANTTFANNSGLETDQSDYVAGIYLAPSKNFNLVAQTRLDRKTLDVARADVSARADYGFFSGKLGYAWRQAIPGILPESEEILGSGSIRVAKNWYTFGSIRYDFTNDRILSDSVGLKYADECYVMAISYSETFFRDGEIKPDQTVMLRLELKQIGGVDIRTDVIGD